MPASSLCYNVGMDTKIIVGAAVSAVLALSAFADRPWVVINEDNDHYFKNDISLDKEFWKDRSNEALMTKEALEAYADQFCASGKVTHVFWCPQGQCANYDSKVWDPIWWGLSDTNCCWRHSPPKNGDLGKPNNFAKNAKLLFDRGIDPYKVWIDRTRTHGVSPWISMRMNDCHWAWIKNHYRCTHFSHNHPEYRVGQGEWDMACMDYAIPEVREHHLKMFKELVDRYDGDGLEMDFLRGKVHFKSASAKKNAPLMTEFIRQCRAYANEKSKRTGRPYLLAIRIDAQPDKCRAAGFDVETIAKEGLVDVIIPCINQPYAEAVTVIPYAEWAEIAKAAPKPIRIVGGKNVLGGFLKFTPEIMKGWAQSMHAAGAHDIYLFNLPYAYPETRYAVCREGVLDEAKCRTGRRVFLLPNLKSYGVDVPADGKVTYDLPKDLAVGKGATLRVYFAKGCKEIAAPVLKVNGAEVAYTERPNGKGGAAFLVFDLAKALKPGANALEFAPNCKGNIRELTVE